MRTRRIVGFLSATFAVCGGLAACHEAPSRAPSEPASPASPSSNVAMTRVEISGPDRVAPGETAQFAAKAYHTDGSSRDVTNEVGWTSADERLLSISRTGLATAQSRSFDAGTNAADFVAYIRASFDFGSISGNLSKEVLILRAGTYRVVGIVTDGGLGARSFRVDVTGGPATGLSHVACDSQGKCGGFNLFGLSGETRIEVTRDGYQPAARTVQVSSDLRLEFELIPLRPRADVAGTYTMTITAAADCRSALPEDLRTRTYNAVISQDGPSLTGRLGGANFIISGRDHFDGQLDPDRVTFRLGGWRINDDGSVDVYPDALEQLTPTLFLTVSGFARTTITPSGLTGTLEGFVETVQKIGVDRFQKVASCNAEAHGFSLSR